MKTDEVVLTFFDVKRFAKRHRVFVLRCSGVFAGLMLLFFLMQPLKYQQEATVRFPSGSSSVGAKAPGLLENMAGDSCVESKIALFQSKRLITAMIEELGLQADCFTDGWLMQKLRTVQARLLFEWGFPQSASTQFSFGNIKFEEETPLCLFLRLVNKEEYELLDSKQQRIALAKIGTGVKAVWGQLTLLETPFNAQIGRCYHLKLATLEKGIKKWKDKVKISSLKANKEIVQLRLTYPDRFLGARVLNTLVSSYEKLIRQEAEEAYAAQMRLLRERQESLATSYGDSLLDYAQNLEKNIHGIGFGGYSQEIEAFETTQNTCLSKLFDLDLQLKRLELATSFPKQQERSQRGLSLCPLMHSQEFSGLTAPLVMEILTDYTKQNQALQAQLNELQFLKKQIKAPGFEVSSLGGFSEDSVVRGLVDKASEIALQLEDKGNRSARELERLMQELTTQKEFLLHYLSQVSDLKSRKSDLLVEKIVFLKSEAERLLKSEQHLFKEKQRELKASIQGLPQRWYQESRFNFKQEQLAAMLKGIEQATLSIHLGKRGNEPELKLLDKARVPYEPSSFKLWQVAFTSGLIGVFVLYVILFFKTLYQGFPVSGEMLKAWGFEVCGSLKQKGALLHRLAGFLSTPVAGSQLSVLIGREHADYAAPLAQRLSKRGYKTLLIDCVPSANKEESCGYDHHILESEAVVDHLCSPSFAQKLAACRAQYDHILLSMNLAPSQAEGLSLLSFADRVVLTVQEEKKEDLLPYIRWSERKQENCLAFVYGSA